MGQQAAAIRPVFVYTDLTTEELVRLADLDNENDEYHFPVPLIDVWEEYHRLANNENPIWTQQRIADASCHAHRFGWAWFDSLNGWT
jgi:hypothetical protein